MTQFMSQYTLYDEIYFKNIDISLSGLGSDTVILGDNTSGYVYICGHFKEFKISKLFAEQNDFYVLRDQKMKNSDIILEGQDMKFINQMEVLNKILLHFYEKDCYILCDANTQVVQGSESNTLTFYEKEGKATKNGFVINGQTFEFDVPLFVENKNIDDMLTNNTTNKMRGTHTSQLNKSFIVSKTNIDYLMYKPKQEKEVSIKSKIYVLDNNGCIKNKLPHELTTSTVGISDHSPVISYVNELCLGTFNIKGGNTKDTTWAEFLMEDYKNYFLEEVVQEKINELLLEAFKDCKSLTDLSVDEKLKKINTKNFVSEQRFSICEVHLNPQYVPVLKMTNEGIYCSFKKDGKEIYKMYFHYQDNVRERYIVSYEILGDTTDTTEENEIMSWMNVLLKDLNQYNDKQTEEWNIENQHKRIEYFQERVLYLLNFYQLVQQDRTRLYNDLSLFDIYVMWYLKNQNKVSIKEMLIQLKEFNPLMKVIALQEYPVDNEVKDLLSSELNTIGTVYLNSSPFVIDKKQSATQGCVFVYDDVFFSYLK
jgi:hypothetical protein